MSMTQTTPLLEAQRAAEQKALADRHNGVTETHQKSQWLISTYSKYLPPEHVALAQRLAYLQAIIEGCRVVESRVDSCSNGSEASLVARMDAQRELEGYKRAGEARVGKDAKTVVDEIANSQSLAHMMDRLDIPRGSNGTARRLVQKTLIALAEYKDENEAQATRWNKMGDAA